MHTFSDFDQCLLLAVQLPYSMQYITVHSISLCIDYIDAQCIGAIGCKINFQSETKTETI